MLSFRLGRRQTACSVVDVVGKSVSGVCILTEKKCDVLVIRLTANFQMKCMKRDKIRSFQEYQLRRSLLGSKENIVLALRHRTKTETSILAACHAL